MFVKGEEWAQGERGDWSARDRALYVGTSSSIATRVRSYFTAAEKRARISEMLAAAERRATARGLDNVDFRECSADDRPFDEASFDSVSFSVIA